MVFDPQPDWRVALYAVALTTLTGLAFGLMPALQSTRRDLGVDFRDVTATDRRDSRKLQNTLVTLQVAVCLILLLSAGLLTRGLYRAQTLDPGINMANVTVVGYDLPNAGYKAPAAAAFQRQVIERLAALPGVRGRRAERRDAAERFALRDAVRLSGHRSLHACRVQPGHAVVLRRPAHPHRPRAQFHGRRSRVRSGADRDGVDGAAAVARRRSARPGAHARQDHAPRRGRGARRAGVAARADRTSRTCSFRRARRRSCASGSSWPARARRRRPVRSARPSPSLDPQLAVEITRLEDNLELWRAPSKLVAALSATLALLALVLACTGVFGTVAYTVSRRVREIGIRVALGAAHEDVLRLIVRQGMRPVRDRDGDRPRRGRRRLDRARRHAVRPEPVTIRRRSSLASAALFAIALAACYVPARRALRVEPTTALRTE